MAAEASSTIDFAIPEEEINFTGPVLGVGAFATVSKAVWIGTPVAVKRIQQFSDNVDEPSKKRESERLAEALDVFRKDASLSCRLLHPRIVRLFGVYAPATRHVGLVMELMETTLYSRVKEKSALTTLCITHVLHDMASALTYLHSRNVLHRDISPRNTLLSTMLDDHSDQLRLTAKLSDFATAKAVKTIGFDNHSATNVGTFSYLPYEAIDNDPVTDALVYSSAVDVYSVGAVGLFSVLHKKPGNTPGAKSKYLERVGSEHPLYALFKACLLDDAGKRPSSKELLAELGQIRLDISELCTCAGAALREASTSDRAVIPSTEDGMPRAKNADPEISESLLQQVNQTDVPEERKCAQSEDDAFDVTCKILCMFALSAQPIAVIVASSGVWLEDSCKRYPELPYLTILGGATALALMLLVAYCDSIEELTKRLVIQVHRLKWILSTILVMVSGYVLLRILIGDTPNSNNSHSCDLNFIFLAFISSFVAGLLSAFLLIFFCIFGLVILKRRLR